MTLYLFFLSSKVGNKVSILMFFFYFYFIFIFIFIRNKFIYYWIIDFVLWDFFFFLWYDFVKHLDKYYSVFF